MNKETIIIIGAGQAGATVAIQLRQDGFTGRIILVGDEPHLPYERPPLSKERLLTPDTTNCQIFSADFYAEKQIEVRNNEKVTSINTQTRQILLANGEKLDYFKLVITTGASVKHISMLDELGEKVHTLRTIDDADMLRLSLSPEKRIAIIGGGVIGLELASTAIDLGCQVNLVDTGNRVMRRSIPPILSQFLFEQHQKNGVQFHMNTGLRTASRNQDNSFTLTLENGTCLQADAIVYGIGVEPNVNLAIQAGIRVNNGIVINSHGQTSDPDIYAAGDVTACWQGQTQTFTRTETWENAQNQAITVAKAILAQNPPEFSAPWFWTDQCGLNIQLCGQMNADQWICRGDMNAPEGFILFGFLQDILVGAITVNQGREMRNLKKMIALQHPFCKATLENKETNLRQLSNSVTV